MENHAVTFAIGKVFFVLGFILMPIQQAQSADSNASKSSASSSCDPKPLRKVVDAYARSKHLRFITRRLDCERGWAVLGGDLAYPNAPSDGPQGVGTSLIFHREGFLWKHQEHNAVCGTLNPEKPNARPNDAKIPPSLYFIGCLVG